MTKEKQTPIVVSLLEVNLSTLVVLSSNKVRKIPYTKPGTGEGEGLVGL